MDTAPNPTGTSLVSKLSSVMGEIGRIPKKGHNDYHNYDFVREADLVEAVRDRLAKRNVFITSSVKNVEVVELSKMHKGEVVTLKVGVLHIEYTIRDGDSGEAITLNGIGEIDQDGGKGLYKAMTGALKYALMKTFLIPTGDDPENDGGQKRPAQRATGEQATREAACAPPKPAATAHQEKKAEAASSRQLGYIESLARERNLFDIRSQVYAPRGIAGEPTKEQAKRIIDELKLIKATPAKRKAATEQEVIDAERAAQKTA